jgi:hypothetical protein
LAASIRPPQDKTLDAYVWADAAGQPGAVLSLRVGYYPATNPVWPEYGHHVVQLPPGCHSTPSWWAGAWWNWGDQHSPFYWYVMADVDGPGGCPMIKVPPDIGGGYPSGWQSVSLIWRETTAIGIGVQIQQLLPSEVPEPSSEPSTWGRVKALHQD